MIPTKQKLIEIITQQGKCGHTLIFGCRISCPLRQQDGSCTLRVDIPRATFDVKVILPAELEALRRDQMYRIAVNEFVNIYGQDELIEVLM